MKRLIVSSIALLATASVAMGATSVEVNTPGASVRVGTPPPPQVIVVDPVRPVVIDEHRHDNGKHKGHKKHKKHKKEYHEDRGEHRGEGHHK